MTPEEHLVECMKDARRKLGADQPIFVKKGIAFEHCWEEIGGHRCPLGVISPFYLRDGSIELRDARVLVCQDELADDYGGLVPIMEQLSQNTQTLVVAAPRIGGDVAGMFVINHTRETMQVAGLHGPERPAARAILQELCTVTGAKLTSGGESVTEDHLGQADRIWANRKDTLIWTANGDPSAMRGRALLFSVGGNSPAEIEHLLTVASSHCG